MADYRGGGNEISGRAAQAVRDLNAGNTPGQRARDARRRLTGGVIQAGLAGLGGLIQMDQANNAEYDHKKGIMKDAIRNAKAASEKQQHQKWLRSSGGDMGPQAGFKDAPDDFRSDTSVMMDNAIRAGQNNNPYVEQTKDGSRLAIAKLDANEASAQVNHGGEWNPGAAQGMAEGASMQAHDIGLAKDLMRQHSFGGIGNSLRMK